MKNIQNNMLKCECDVGFENGAVLKNIETTNFKIYGSFIKGHSIVIKYFGFLVEYIEDLKNKHQENSLYVPEKIYLSYYYNDDFSTSKTVELSECVHSTLKNYCISINLEENNSLSFYFISTSGFTDKMESASYRYEIEYDPIKALMEKYCFEKNDGLPVLQEKKFDFAQAFSNLLENIKKVFNKKT